MSELIERLFFILISFLFSLIFFSLSLFFLLHVKMSTGWWNLPFKKARYTPKPYTYQPPRVNPRSQRKYRTFIFDAEIKWWMMPGGDARFRIKTINSLKAFNTGNSYLQENQALSDAPLDSGWPTDYEPITVVINGTARNHINFTISFFDARTYGEATQIIINQLKHSFNFRTLPISQLRGVPHTPTAYPNIPRSRTSYRRVY